MEVQQMMLFKLWPLVEAKDDFINDRLKKEKKRKEKKRRRPNLFKPLNRLNLKTIDNTSNIFKVTTTKNKITQYKHQVTET